jgi:hypothetical protein
MSDLDNAYDEIRNLKARLARIEGAVVGPSTRIWTTKEIENRDVWAAHKSEILLAAREGRIVEPSPVVPPPPVEYPDSGDPRLTQVGPGIFVSEPLKEKA